MTMGISYDVAGFVARQLELREQIPLKSDLFRVPHFKIAFPLLSFSQFLARYNESVLFNINLLLRHERDLRAWAAVGEEVVDSGVWAVACWDYVHPLLEESSNLPLAIKDQVMHAVVALDRLVDPEANVADVLNELKEQNGWFAKAKQPVSGATEKGDLLMKRLELLWDVEPGLSLRSRHGNRQHNVLEPLVGSIPEVGFDDNGVLFYGWSDSLNLPKELEMIEQSIEAVRLAYDAFVTRALELEEMAIGRCPWLTVE